MKVCSATLMQQGDFEPLLGVSKRISGHPPGCWALLCREGLSPHLRLIVGASELQRRPLVPTCTEPDAAHVVGAGRC